MATGKKTGGRKVGTPNQLSGTAKENIAAVFVRLGGTAAMAEWAKENQTPFYQLYSKLLPVEVSNPEGEEFKTVTRIENVIIDGNTKS